MENIFKKGSNNSSAERARAISLLNIYDPKKFFRTLISIEFEESKFIYLVKLLQNRRLVSSECSYWKECLSLLKTFPQRITKLCKVSLERENRSVYLCSLRSRMSTKGFYKTYESTNFHIKKTEHYPSFAFRRDFINSKPTKTIYHCKVYINFSFTKSRFSGKHREISTSAL